MPSKQRKTKAPDPLDRFAASPLDRVLQLVFWKLRHKNPDMAVLITQADLEAFDQSMAYQDITPTVMVERPQGRPAHEGARGRKITVAPFAGEPPRPFVIVAVVEKGKKNAVRAIENNQEDFDQGALLRQIAQAKGKARVLAAAVRQSAASGDFTSGTLEEAASCLELFAKVP